MPPRIERLLGEKQGFALLIYDTKQPIEGSPSLVSDCLSRFPRPIEMMLFYWHWNFRVPARIRSRLHANRTGPSPALYLGRRVIHRYNIFILYNRCLFAPIPPTLLLGVKSGIPSSLFQESVELIAGFEPG